MGAEDQDVRMVGSVLETVKKQNRIERLKLKLDIAEAVNAATVGSSPHKENQKTYARWLRSTEREIAKEQGQKLPTLWDRLVRKSRRLRRR